MKSKLFTYRIKFLMLSLSGGILGIQLEPFLSSRGISTATIITVFGIGQLISMACTLIWARLIHESNNGHVVYRMGVMIRICIVGLMFVCFNNYLLICLVLMYYMTASCLDLANEARVMKWSSEENQDFGRIRLFGSLGFAVSGLVASVIVLITEKIDYVILFAFCLNIIVVSLSFYRPVRTPAIIKKNDSGVKLDVRTKIMLICVVIPMVLPACFNFILNYHYREYLGLSLEEAVLFSGLAVLFSAGLSEIPAMMFIQRIIEKLGPKNIVIIGLIASVLRWTFASVAHSPLLFTTTYLLHGICFSFTYIGFTTLVKNRLGNDSIPKVLTLVSFLVAMSSVILSQMFKYFIQYFDTFMILKCFIIISALCTATFIVVSKRATVENF